MAVTTRVPTSVQRHRFPPHQNSRPIRNSECFMLRSTANEVEGPAAGVGQAPRAQTVPQRPRRQTAHASRPLERLLGGVVAKYDSNHK